MTHIQGRVALASPGGGGLGEAAGEGAGELVSVQLSPEGSAGFNPAFDVTPARLVTALITERGVCAASEAALQALYDAG